jgi:peptidoglycan/LPS O-acetylase OafA/YrhL
MGISMSHLDPAVYRWGTSLVALTTAAVIVWVVTSPSSTLGRCLTFAPLTWAGRLSYGIYLWHIPVFRLVEKVPLPDRRLLPLVQILVSLAVAAVSFYGFERYFMRFAPRFDGAAPRHRPSHERRQVISPKP